MIAVDQTVLVLLAAGRSERFGDVGSKLDQDLEGRPLGLHVALALKDMPFSHRVAVVGRASLDYAEHGFEVVRNGDRGAGMASSVKLGVTRARELGAAAVLIVLADMPRVTAAHIERLFDAATDAATVVASSDGREPKPPAIFGSDRFDVLLSLDGDAGARDLIRAGRHVVASPAELIDIDTREELERLRALIGSQGAITRAERRLECPCNGGLDQPDIALAVTSRWA